MFNTEESLTHQEILLRFKKLFNRDMTPADNNTFFLPFEIDAVQKRRMVRPDAG